MWKRYFKKILSDIWVLILISLSIVGIIILVGVIFYFFGIVGIFVGAALFVWGVTLRIRVSGEISSEDRQKAFDEKYGYIDRNS